MRLTFVELIVDERVSIGSDHRNEAGDDSMNDIPPTPEAR
jgi:hypothetical protein